MKLSITDKIQLEKPVLEIGGHEFEVDNSKDSMLAFDEKMRSLPEGTSNLAVLDLTVEHFLGEDANRTISSMGLTVKGYEKLAIAVMSLAGEEDFEIVEARFRREEQPASTAVV